MPSPRDKKLHLRGKKRQKYLFHIPLSPKLISKDSVRLVGLLGMGGGGGGFSKWFAFFLVTVSKMWALSHQGTF